MGFVRFAVEMECLDEVRTRLHFFFRRPFRNHSHILRDAHDLTFAGEDLMDFVAVYLIDSNGTGLVLVIQLCLFDESCDKILNCAILWNENVKQFLVWC